MSVTIADLDWQNDKRHPISTVLEDQYSWMEGFSVFSGYKGKSLLHDFALSAPLLSDANCNVDVNDISLSNKEIEIPAFRFVIPVPRCDYNQTWLASFAKGASVETTFLEHLREYVYEQMGSEIRDRVLGNIFAEGTADANVVKVAGGNVGSINNAFNSIKQFIQDLPISFLADALGSETETLYTIYCSPELYSKALVHMADFGMAQTDASEFILGGFRVAPAAGLVEGQMGCTYLKNLMIIFDDENDVNDFKVTKKDELGLDYISGGVAVVGSYQYSDKIVLTDNF